MFLFLARPRMRILFTRQACHDMCVSCLSGVLVCCVLGFGVYVYCLVLWHLYVFCIFDHFVFVCFLMCLWSVACVMPDTWHMCVFVFCTFGRRFCTRMFGVSRQRRRRGVGFFCIKDGDRCVYTSKYGFICLNTYGSVFASLLYIRSVCTDVVYQVPVWVLACFL